jgi:toxin ParE1/3/4
VRRPVHVIYYREIAPGLVEIVRILHERMEPGRWLTASFDEEA